MKRLTIMYVAEAPAPAVAPTWLQTIHAVNREAPGSFGEPELRRGGDLEVYPSFEVEHLPLFDEVRISALTPGAAALLRRHTATGVVLPGEVA